MFGLFQMSRPLRAQYGAGDSTNPEVQTRAFAAFTRDLQNGLAARLGRPPTNAETYVAHYFGEGRAARLISGEIPSNTDVRDVFTPQELAQNPEIARSGSTGALVNSIAGDISRREAEWGDGAPSGGLSASSAPVDFTQFGQSADGVDIKGNSEPIDFSRFGATTASTQNPTANTQTDPTAALADVRLDNLNAQYGVPKTGADIVSAMPSAPGTEIDLSQLGLPAAQPQQAPA